MAKEEEEVKLLGFWVSPAVFRIRWALKLKGVDYEYVEENIWGDKSNLLELQSSLQQGTSTHSQWQADS